MKFCRAWINLINVISVRRCMQIVLHLFIFKLSCEYDYKLRLSKNYSDKYCEFNIK